MSTGMQAMSVEEVRENLDIRKGAPDERCPGCGRQYSSEVIEIHVPGKPDKSFRVYRCSYCETLFDCSGEGEAPNVGAALADLCSMGQELREKQRSADSIWDRAEAECDARATIIGHRNRDGVPLSPAAIGVMLQASGVGDMLRLCGSDQV